MKIFFVDAYDPLANFLFNGLQNILINKKNVELYFIGPIEKNNFYDGIKNKQSIKQVWNFNHFVRKIYSFLRKNKPDIIHYNFELRFFSQFRIAIKLPLLVILSYISGTKVFVTFHELYVSKEEKGWGLFEHQEIILPRFIVKLFAKFFIKIIALFSHKVMVFSKVGQDALINFYKIPSNKILQINFAPTGIKNISNLEKKKTMESKFYGKKIILIFGSISPRKNYEIIIESMEIISKIEPNSLLLIAGYTNPYNKSYEKTLQELPKKLNIKNNVSFFGPCDDDEVAILFNLAEVALYLYKPLSYGSASIHNVIQYNTPTIATNYETFKEILGENNAIYVDFNDKEQISNSILKVISNPNFKNELKKRLNLISEKFSWEKNAEKILNEYEKSLESYKK